jgi:ACS family tartrate transporter-like MFS transporter
MDLERQTMAKVTRRLVPFLMLCYFVAYLDRFNVAFAALTMNKALGFSAEVFGLGVGLFFLGYFVFEVPSNILLDRFGARRWIARIMVSWGVLAVAMAWVQGETSFYILRVLLGVAEAGFFPGIIFYLSLWFPAAYRGRIIGYFMAAIPLSSVLGAPLSGFLLTVTHGWFGFQGWQMMFIVEGVPAILLGLVVLRYLTDRPTDADWLEPAERKWLVTRMETERRQREAVHRISTLQALTHGRVLALAWIYFSAVAATYGLGFFLPTIIHGFGLSVGVTSLVAALPFLVGSVSVVLWGRRSDMKRERKGHAAFALLVAGAGIGASTAFASPVLQMLCFCIASFGIFGVLPVFWTLPTAILSGTAAAAGIAAINSLGNLAGFFGPYAVGYLKTHTGSFTAGLLLIAVVALSGVVALILLPHDDAHERVQARQPAE